jgi:hypothetical protein
MIAYAAFSFSEKTQKACGYEYVEVHYILHTM